MENAAMAAYLKDVEGNTIDLTAQQIIQNKQAKNFQLPQPDVPEYLPQATPQTNPRNKQSKHVPGDVDFCDPTTFHRAQSQRRPPGVNVTAENKAANKGKNKSKDKKNQEADSVDKKSVRKIWYEARTSNGYTYYWNIETNETSWEVPGEGFMSLIEQEAEVQEEQIQNQFFELMDNEKKEEMKTVEEERRANAAREKMKRLRENKKTNEKGEPNEDNEESTNEVIKEEEVPYRRDYSIPERVDPYGPWQTVSIKPQTKVDLQLPKKKVSKMVIAVKKPEPPAAVVPMFTEKTITRLGNDDDDTPVAFKKRKFHNKNVRQRLDND